MNEADLKAKLELLLTEEEAREFFKRGPEAVIFKLMELSKRIEELEGTIPSTHSSTPSGMKAPYEKPPVTKSRKKPGRKKGHPGVRRKAPIQIDRRETHSLDNCPKCGNPVGKVTRKRKRIIEDVTQFLKVIRSFYGKFYSS